MDRTEQIKWADALEVFTGFQFPKRDVLQGLQLARECQHPDALWVCALFPDLDAIVTAEQVLRVLEEQNEDRRALFIRSHINGDFKLLRRAAELGYAPAQAVWSRWCGTSEQLAWAERAALQGDRNGLFELGSYLWSGEGCDIDCVRALGYWKEAVELGDCNAFWEYGLSFSENDWQRYHWWGKGAARGYGSSKVDIRTAAAKRVLLFEEGKESGRVVFELGRAFKGHVDVAEKIVFGMSELDEEKLLAVQRCLALHEKWTAAATEAIEFWLVAGRRLGVAKDVRLMIARLLWMERASWSEK